ncbi:MAG: hypothetical protein ABI442_05200 [Gemmatimonadaceae bacterium]
MLLLLGAALALNQQVRVQVGGSRERQTIVRDSTNDSTKTDSLNRRKAYRRAVTADVIASAFKDQTAKSTLAHARAARLIQDSALTSYDAQSYDRMSVGMGLGSVGRDHLLYRHESAGRVVWKRGVGVRVEMTGARTAIPVASKSDEKDANHDSIRDQDLSVPIPYYPGVEPLWVQGSTIRSTVNESDMVHPLADGSEAYYTYQTGDSISFKLPDGTVIKLRELKVRPREPKWNLAIGSFWFDTRSGQVVRAAYRLAVPIDVWNNVDANKKDSSGNVPGWLKAIASPLKGQLNAVAIEYSLHDGRFWLPRLREMDVSAQASFMHIPVKWEQSYTYNSVNKTDYLAPIVIAGHQAAELTDSATLEHEEKWRDSVRTARRATYNAQRDSVRRGLKKRMSATQLPAACDTASTYTLQNYRYGGRIPVAVQVPCDESKLENSKDLPKSIYTNDEELFGAQELADLKNEALSLGAQAPFSLSAGLLQPPTITYGLSLMRYNRIEGFSLGVSAEQELGGGYTSQAIGRFGFADREPNLELGVFRTNYSKTITFTGYNRLVSASDWGHPLTFGSSFAALMFGRDEGFYYRASGAEVTKKTATSLDGGTTTEWRAFFEEQRNAAVNTNFAVNGADLPANLVAWRGAYGGLGAKIHNEYGLDPRGFRLISELRLEAAMGDSAYGRGALEFTASHGLGPIAGALTAAGGSSVGALPPQRLWYLGGSQTVRGQSPDPAQSGNAFWLTRAELGTSDVGFRPTVFADLGWAGDRTKLGNIGRPMSGVGVGASIFDGMFRFDVARGVFPRKQFRVDLSLERTF